jgi:hypothetical protein
MSGESVKVSPEKVGHALKVLGLYAAWDAKGRCCLVLDTTEIRVHKLTLA